MKLLIVCAVAIFSLSIVSESVAQQTLTKPASPQELKKKYSDDVKSGDMGNILVNGLKEIEGCIGVKTCQWSDGKRSIVAWFENKEAATAWYYSSTHQAMIGNKTDKTKNDEPMKHITDENHPIMVIATLTPATKPELPGINIPISQISIELFAALPGGAQVGGRVSPVEFDVPHMRDYTEVKPKPIEGNGQSSKGQ